jgi:hypothetical protein
MEVVAELMRGRCVIFGHPVAIFMPTVRAIAVNDGGVAAGRGDNAKNRFWRHR